MSVFFGQRKRRQTLNVRGQLIAPHPRVVATRELAPAQAARFKERSAAERLNSLLKQRNGGRWVRVRGAAKAMCHLTSGLVPSLQPRCSRG